MPGYVVSLCILEIIYFLFVIAIFDLVQRCVVYIYISASLTANSNWKTFLKCKLCPGNYKSQIPWYHLYSMLLARNVSHA